LGGPRRCFHADRHIDNVNVLAFRTDFERSISGIDLLEGVCLDQGYLIVSAIHAAANHMRQQVRILLEVFGVFHGNLVNPLSAERPVFFAHFHEQHSDVLILFA
jgi:hypothetical protein